MRNLVRDPQTTITNNIPEPERIPKKAPKWVSAELTCIGKERSKTGARSVPGLQLSGRRHALILLQQLSRADDRRSSVTALIVRLWPKEIVYKALLSGSAQCPPNANSCFGSSLPRGLRAL